MGFHTELARLQVWFIPTAAAAAAESLQSCPTLCDPIDGSPPGSAIPGILQARTLAWVAISFSNAWKWKVKVKSLSCVWLFATPWTAAHQAPLSMGFSRQEYWSGVPLPSPAYSHYIAWKTPASLGRIFVKYVLASNYQWTNLDTKKKEKEERTTVCFHEVICQYGSTFIKISFDCEFISENLTWRNN